MRCSSRGPRVTPKGRFICGGQLGAFPWGAAWRSWSPPKALQVYPRVQNPSLGSLTSHWSRSQPQLWAGSMAGGGIPAQLGPPTIPVPPKCPWAPLSPQWCPWRPR